MKYIIYCLCTILFCSININVQAQSKHFDKGLKYYSANEYVKAAKEFEAAFKATSDYAALYNAGYSYYSNKDYAKAALFFEQCIDANYYRDGEIYANLGDCYLNLGDAERAKNIIENGFIAFPLSQSIIVRLINYYIDNKEELNQLFTLLDEVKINNPNSAPLYYLEGNIYSQFGEIEKAIEAYERANIIDPNYAFGFIGIGILYYNQALEIQEKAQNALDKEYEFLQNEFYTALMKAIEPFERAFAISTDNSIKLNIAEYLSNIYNVFKEQGEQYKSGYEKYSGMINSMQK